MKRADWEAYGREKEAIEGERRTVANMEEAAARRARKRAGHSPHFTTQQHNGRTTVWVSCAACDWRSNAVTSQIEAQALYDRQHGAQPTGYEQAARDRKAWHLYDACQQTGINADDLADDDVRAKLLAYARVWRRINDPSATTWALVVKRLRDKTDAGHITVGDLAGGLLLSTMALITTVLVLLW